MIGRSRHFFVLCRWSWDEVGTPKYEIPGQINDDCGLVRPGPVLPVDKRIEVG